MFIVHDPQHYFQNLSGMTLPPGVDARSLKNSVEDDDLSEVPNSGDAPMKLYARSVSLYTIPPFDDIQTKCCE